MPATSSINTTHTISGEIVIQERATTNEFVIRDITESIEFRFVKACIELGPFTSTGINELPRGSGRRVITAWENENYDAVRDTWNNGVLISRITEILNNE